VDPTPFLRGVAFPATEGVPYPRAKPADAARLPADTWARARIPVGVRLELVGDAEAVEVDYETATDDLGPRGEGAGRAFAAWRGEALLAEEPAVLGRGTARLELGEPSEAPVVIHLPEGMRPRLLDLRADGWVEPARPGPRWVCYGDSVAEGWLASQPALAWPHRAARAEGLDVLNLGYAGAARGEIVSAEHVAELAADVISIAHGTNCWLRVPHSTAQMRANLAAFLDVVRQGHPETPVVVCSPILRPDAEGTPNRLGATLADLRAAMEEVVRERAAGDARLRLVEGRDLLGPAQLADGIHPNDEGHRALAEALGPVLREAIAG
jgi:lysophospholipase L1-like esterase